MAAPKQNWQEVAAAKRASLLASIPKEWLIPRDLMPGPDVLNIMDFRKSSGIFTEEELEITEATALGITDKISKSLWRAEQVASAFCKAAAIAHQLTNCLTETLFNEALVAAKRLDEHFAKTGNLVGPLHGVPISLKDNFNIAGKPSSLGFVAWANDISTSNSSLVDLLVRLGAIVYVKTNVPTAMMIAETVNNVFGRTTNPLNRNLTPGGSSGGESALIAFRGSSLGVGSDIGGSLRIPAACCGLFTLRPSYGRFPNFDTKSGMAGQEAVPSVNGPLARTLPDMYIYTKAIIDSEPWLIDPKCVPIPWRTICIRPKLKLGVLWNDGVVTPTPPVKRALSICVEKLRKDGHEVVDWGNEGHVQAITLLGRMFVADGGKSIRNVVESSGESWQPEMTNYAAATELGVYDMWQIHRERNALTKMYLDRWNSCNGLDAILCPTTPYASVKHGDFKYVGYTGIWNVFDYSAISFPTGLTVEKEIDILPHDLETLSELDAVVQSKYAAADVHGMPISLQLVGRRLEEEKILAVTEKVLNALS